MKKQIITLLFVMGAFFASAQTTREIYIIFDPLIPYPSLTEFIGKSGGISPNIENGDYCFELIKYVNNQEVYCYYFFYFPDKDGAIQTKPDSYLTELQNRGVLIDWDQFYATKTDAEIKAFCEGIGKDQVVYFINRQDRAGSYEIKIVPTKRAIPSVTY